MSHHDGSKPYQPRRGPERHPQPVDGIAAPPPAAVAPSMEHLVAAAAEAEALNRFGAEQQQQLQGHEQEVGEEEEEDEEEDEMEVEEDEHEGQHGGIGGEHVPMDADAAAAAAAASGAQMDPHSALVPGTVPPMATNQLTLSFQGEVYVFDSVFPAAEAAAHTSAAAEAGVVGDARVVGAPIGAAMELFMIHTGFYDKVVVLESEKRAWESSPEAQAMREALNPWRKHDEQQKK